MTDIHLRETASTSNSLKVKQPPSTSSIPVPFSYNPSDDGTDENLLILLHGLGDTHVPFSKLGRQLKLPQTAVLALRAPQLIPFLYEDAYQWYESFDGLGELISRPNPTPALDLLSTVHEHLTKDLQWPSHRIHLFGFAQGGSVAAEFGAKLWKAERAAAAKSTTTNALGDDDRRGGETARTVGGGGVLGSIVTIAGPLLSYPTLSSLSPTPVLVIHNPPPAETALPSGAVTAFKKAFRIVVEKTNKKPGMPSSKEGWQPIMEFWSQHLGRRQGEGLYEVMSGMGKSA